MEFKFLHTNIYTIDLEKSIAFYEEALDLKEVRRLELDDFILVYMGDGITSHQLEITWIKNHKTPYSLGDCTWHVAFEAKDFDKAHKKHEEMGCICYDNPKMGIYFINDPDGNWMEIIPPKK